MFRSLALFGIGLIFGAGAGFVTAAGYGVTFEGHDHGDPAQHGEAGSHDHATTVNFSSGADAPGLEVMLAKDPMAGWNLHVIPRNFRFSPENASLADRPGEGHAHVYVNGAKLARLYGEWMHIDELPKGEVEIEVSLNANDHSQLTVDDVPVAASVAVQVD